MFLTLLGAIVLFGNSNYSTVQYILYMENKIPVELCLLAVSRAVPVSEYDILHRNLDFFFDCCYWETDITCRGKRAMLCIQIRIKEFSYICTYVYPDPDRRTHLCLAVCVSGDPHLNHIILLYLYLYPDPDHIIHLYLYSYPDLDHIIQLWLHVHSDPDHSVHLNIFVSRSG